MWELPVRRGWWWWWRWRRSSAATSSLGSWSGLGLERRASLVQAEGPAAGRRGGGGSLAQQRHGRPRAQQAGGGEAGRCRTPSQRRRPHASRWTHGGSSGSRSGVARETGDDSKQDKKDNGKRPEALGRCLSVGEGARRSRGNSRSPEAARRQDADADERHGAEAAGGLRDGGCVVHEEEREREGRREGLHAVQ